MQEALPTPDPAADGSPQDGSDATPLERWARIKSIFLEVIEQQVAERATLLNRLCGDDVTLKEEVESLLASEVAARSLYETPAAILLESADALPGAGARL